jgi:hypothetical protein
VDLVLTLRLAIQYVLIHIFQGIANNVPVDASIFTANFSSSTIESRLAMQAAFCDAMSAYYYYYSSYCGIPRVKVLGTKQDWETLEHKVHRMRTEVFNQDATTVQKLSSYLQRAETQLHNIHTTRDPAFWKDMFAINKCMSGHSDAVEGWIVLFYREGSSGLEEELFEDEENPAETASVHYTGNDFYNYKSHISTVKWVNLETQRHFELKSGLLYSNIVGGESEDDKKYPWLEPQFCHVTVETDGSGKLTPITFKKYIEETLKGRDKTLMKAFYDVLKDDPIELVKGGSREVDFRLALVGRQIDSWKEDFVKNGKALTKFDLNEDPCYLALDFYTKIGPQNMHALNILKEKIIDYLKTNTNVTQTGLCKKTSPFEPTVLELLIGNPNIEELTVCPSTQESIEKLAQFLLHSDCNLKKLKVVEDRYGSFQDENDEENSKKQLNFSVLAEALIKSSAPIVSLEFDIIGTGDLATAVAELCRRPNGLKHLKFGTDYRVPQNIKEILLRGQVLSTTLRSVVLLELGRWSDEVTDLIVKNLPLNTALETISNFSFPMNAANRTKALQISSLKQIRHVDLQDLSFLAVTKKLSNITATLNCTSEQMKILQDFVSHEDCALETLFIARSTFQLGAGVTLAKGLVLNKSIKTLNCSTMKFGNVEEVQEFSKLIAEWLEKPYCKLEELHLREMSLVSKDTKTLQRNSTTVTPLTHATLTRLMTNLVNNSTLKKLSIDISCNEADVPLFTELARKNTTLEDVYFGNTIRTEFSAQSRAPLAEAIKANKTLVSFYAFFVAGSDQKNPDIPEDELYN